MEAIPGLSDEFQLIPERKELNSEDVGGPLSP
jgi:hypothetical protein